MPPPIRQLRLRSCSVTAASSPQESVTNLVLPQISLLDGSIEKPAELPSYGEFCKNYNSKTSKRPTKEKLLRRLDEAKLSYLQFGKVIDGLEIFC